MFKLLIKAIGPNERWITVHPHGKGTGSGQHVLLRMEKDGKTGRIIAGAGGKLNYLKVTDVKSKESYKASVERKAAKTRALGKLARKRDKELGVDKLKADVKRANVEKVRETEQSAIATVAQEMGWKKEDIEFPKHLYENVSAAARKQALKKHDKALMKRVKEAIDTQKEHLAHNQQDKLMVLGETTPGETVDFSDTENVTSSNSEGLGYRPVGMKEAREKGLSKEKLKEEVAEISDAPGSDPDPELDLHQIDQNIKLVQEPEQARPISVGNIEGIKKMLLAEKQIALVREKKRKSEKKLESANSVEPKAFLVDTTDEEIDEKLKTDLAKDIQTIAAKSFLNKIDETEDYNKTLARHLGTGSYESLNGFSLAVAGQGLVSRETLDVLGVAGAAKVMVHRMQNDLSPDQLEDAKELITSYHQDSQLGVSTNALEEAIQLQQSTLDLELPPVTSTDDLANAQAINAQRRDAINQSEQVLGSALGRLETNAAIVGAFNESNDIIKLSMGHSGLSQSIVKLRAIGLERGDYTIETAGGNKLITILKSGVQRLTQPVDKDEIEKIQTSLDIINGQEDEDDWLPAGVSKRPSLDLKVEPGVVGRLAKPFSVQADIENSVRDYIGGRTADGDNPPSIVADLIAEDFMEKIPDRDSYMQAVDKHASLYDEEGKIQNLNVHKEGFEKLAEEFVQKNYGTTRSPVHQQSVKSDDETVDMVYQALSATPAGAVAFKPIGDLENKDQRVLREYFGQHVAHDSPEVKEIREDLEDLMEKEPVKRVDGLFGEEDNPAHQDWVNKKSELKEQLKQVKLNWGNYCDIMGDRKNAYAAIQDLIKSKVMSTFKDRYNSFNKDNLLKESHVPIRYNLNHADAIDPKIRKERAAEHKKDIDRLRLRDEGRYANGSVTDLEYEQKKRDEAVKQSQMGFFAGGDSPDLFAGGDDALGLFGDTPLDTPVAAKNKPLEPDHRVSLGQPVERLVGSIANRVGTGFKGGNAVDLFNVSMSGKYINQQRAVKLIDKNKRLALAAGVGSGKTLIGLGAFTHLHAQGKAKKGVFLVPSIVQGEFHTAALRYLEPGKYNWSANPKMDQAERIAGYKDKDTHFSVVTHQAFRGDMLSLGAKQEGLSVEETTTRFNNMSEEQRSVWMKDLLQKEGINTDYLMVDEGHDTLNRKGKQNSTLANLVDSVSSNSEHYVTASADPVKNDESELYDLMHKVAPSKYKDRDKFLRRYGVNTTSSSNDLRRELSPYLYSGSVDPNVKRKHQEVHIPLSNSQTGAIHELDNALHDIKLAKLNKRVDVAAMKKLSPSTFTNVPEDQHEKLAEHLATHADLLHNSAVSKNINGNSQSSKINSILNIAKGKNTPGVIFSKSPEMVTHMAKKLEAAGHRVVTITGKDTPQSKAVKKSKFNPESKTTEPEADILIASDAASIGINAQRGQWLVQMDTPDTAKTYEQRIGRIVRTGQKHSVETYDIINDHPVEHAARSRLKRKHDLRDIMTSPYDGLDETGLAARFSNIRARRMQEEYL